MIKLRSAYILCYFIRNRRCSLVVCLGFHQCGIPHRTCRFYCCLAAHQRTRKKDSAEPSFAMEPRLRGSVDSTSSTRGYPLRRGMTAARVYTNLGICIQVQVVYRQFRILCSFLCSGYGRSRFSRVVGLVSFVFHYWGIGAVCACGYGGFGYGL